MVDLCEWGLFEGETREKFPLDPKLAFVWGRATCPPPRVCPQFPGSDLMVKFRHSDNIIL